MDNLLAYSVSPMPSGVKFAMYLFRLTHLRLTHR
jgi:hypothetical protein